MVFLKSRTILFGTALLLSGCSFTSDALWPSLSGDEPESPATAQAADSQKAAAPAPGTNTMANAGQPALGTTNFEPVKVTPGAPTGTFVGEKVVQLRNELQILQRNIQTHNGELQGARVKTIQDSQRYHGTVAAINARLQVGTTPGNPILVQQFSNAQSELERISADVTMMNTLANRVAEDSTMSAYLQESTQAAFGLSGAVDEDHAQLEILQDEVRRTVVMIERLLKEVSEDVRRQTTYLSTERSNLNTLLAGVKTGEIYGQSLVNRTFRTEQPVAASTGSLASHRPLVVIRFDRANVNYQQPLYNAVSRVLDRRKNAAFELVAVTPNVGGPAAVAVNSGKTRRSAEQVLRSLTDMGLPSSRIAMSARTSSKAQTNEVHLYLR
ncbi:MAG: hypothetical protein OQK35_01540 [Alphaproteobacteria bacterium]|nr:hypothetical protein [Rhodospirillales bacterium]MCW9044992.1 hypothetical protein [Alphaproteobacteria bacterium]